MIEGGEGLWTCARCPKDGMTTAEFERHCEIHDIIQSDLQRLEVKANWNNQLFKRG